MKKKTLKYSLQIFGVILTSFSFYWSINDLYGLVIPSGIRVVGGSTVGFFSILFFAGLICIILGGNINET